MFSIMATIRVRNQSVVKHPTIFSRVFLVLKGIHIRGVVIAPFLLVACCHCSPPPRSRYVPLHFLLFFSRFRSQAAAVLTAGSQGDNVGCLRV